MPEDSYPLTVLIQDAVPQVATRTLASDQLGSLLIAGLKQNKLALANLLAIIAGLTNTRIICISTTAILLGAFIATVLRVNVKTGLARVSSKHDLIVVANLECQRWCAAS